MFTENIDNELAKNILGDDYKDDCSYVLISDPDRFVLGVTDASGNIIDEVELRQEYTPLTDEELFADDEVLFPKYEKAPTREKLLSWIITGICILMTVTALATAIIILKLGGVF